MKKFKNHTVQEYCDVLALKTPTPGGGSAAALVGATATALISMVGRYSQGKAKPKQIERRINSTIVKSEKIRQRFIELIDLDAEVYLKVVQARKGTDAQKKKAQKESRKVPIEVCKLCHQAIDLTAVLVEDGNPYLLSDVEVASEMLLASFNSALATLRS